MPTDERAQQSQVHEATGDASSSPVAQERGMTTPPASAPQLHPLPDDAKVVPEPPLDTTIVRDDTADGGPLVIQSDDPDLQR